MGALGVETHKERKSEREDAETSCGQVKMDDAKLMLMEKNSSDWEQTTAGEQRLSTIMVKCASAVNRRAAAGTGALLISLLCFCLVPLTNL